MYAVISTGGKQYRVAPGDKVRVETIPAEVGAELEFSGLIAASDSDGRLLTGNDLSSASVLATVSGQDRADKAAGIQVQAEEAVSPIEGPPSELH